MSIDLVHIRGDKPEAGEEIIKDKPYLPDTDGFKQLLKSHENLCFEDKLKDRLECFVGNIEDDKIDDYHVVCHHIVKGREGIAELIAVKIAYLGIDVDLPRKTEEISKAQNVSGREIAFRQFFNIVGDRYKILIVLPDLYEATSMVPDADIILLDEMVKYCKGIKIWLGGKGSWDLNHLPAYKTLFRRFDPR